MVTLALRIPGHSRTVCETCTREQTVIQVTVMLHLGSQSGEGPELKQRTDACILWRSRLFVCTQSIARILQGFSSTSKTISCQLVWIHFCAMVEPAQPWKQDHLYYKIYLSFCLAAGKGWKRQKSLWSIISLSNCLRTSKYWFCSCLPAFQKS